MLQTHHQTREYIASLDADRLRQSHRIDGPLLERVVTAAADGDQPSFSALVTRFRGRVIRVACSYGLDTTQADDVAQETWVRLHRSLPRLNHPQSLGAWVDKTARNETWRALTRRPREDLTDEELGVDLAEDDPDDDLLQERRALLPAAIAQLPRHQRRLMEALIAESEPSYAEVAAKLDVPIGWIGPTRARALARLRAIMAAEPS